MPPIRPAPPARVERVAECAAVRARADAVRGEQHARRRRARCRGRPAVRPGRVDGSTARRSSEGCRRTPPQSTSGNGRAELPGARGGHACVVAHAARRRSRRSSRATGSPASASSSTASAKRPGSRPAASPIRVNAWSSSSASVQPQRSSARASSDVCGPEAEHVPPDRGERLGAERVRAGRVGPEAEMEELAGGVPRPDGAVRADHRRDSDRVVGAAAKRRRSRR